MSICSLKHSLDEVFDKDFDMDTFLVKITNETLSENERFALNSIKVDPTLPADQQLLQKMNFLRDTKYDLYFANGRNSKFLDHYRSLGFDINSAGIKDDMNRILEIFHRYKGIIRGEPPQTSSLIQFFVNPLGENSFLYKELPVIDFEKDIDVFYGIMNLYLKANFVKLVPSSREFFKSIVTLIEKNSELLTDDISKLFFELKLKDFKFGLIIKESRITNDAIKFFESSELATKYRDAYDFYRKRRLIDEDPISYLIMVRSIKSAEYRNPYILNIIDSDIQKIKNSNKIFPSDVKKFLIGKDSSVNFETELDILQLLFNKFESAFDSLPKMSLSTPVPLHVVCLDYLISASNSFQKYNFRYSQDFKQLRGILTDYMQSLGISPRKFVDFEDSEILVFIYQHFNDVIRARMIPAPKSDLVPQIILQLIKDLKNADLNNESLSNLFKSVFQIIDVEPQYFDALMASMSSKQLSALKNFDFFDFSELDIYYQLNEIEKLGIPFANLAPETRFKVQLWNMKQRATKISDKRPGYTFDPLYVLNVAKDEDYFTINFDKFFTKVESRFFRRQNVLYSRGDVKIIGSVEYVNDPNKFINIFQLPPNAFETYGTNVSLAQFKQVLYEQYLTGAYFDPIHLTFEDWYRVNVYDRYFTPKTYVKDTTRFVDIFDLPNDAFEIYGITPTFDQFKEVLYNQLLNRGYFDQFTFESWYTANVYNVYLRPNNLSNYDPGNYVQQVEKIAEFYNLPLDTFADKSQWTVLELKQRLLEAFIQRSRDMTNEEIVLKYGIIGSVDDYYEIWRSIKRNNLTQIGLSSTTTLKEQAKNDLIAILILNRTPYHDLTLKQKLEILGSSAQTVLQMKFDPTGIYGISKYSEVVRNMIKYTDVSIFAKAENPIFYKIIDDFFDNNQLDSFLDYLYVENEALYDYLLERSASLRQVLATSNQKLFDNNRRNLIEVLVNKYQLATTVKDKIAILAISKQFGLTKFIKDKLSDVNNLKDILTTATLSFPNRLYRNFFSSEDGFQFLTDAYRSLILSENQKLFKYSDKLSTLYQKMQVYKGFLNSGIRSLKNYFIDDIPFSFDSEIISIPDYLNILQKFKLENLLTFDDVLDLIFVFYKQSDIPLDLTVYVNNALVDLEFYAPAIYNQLAISNLQTLNYYKTYLSQRFQSILLILRVIDPTTRGAYIEQLKQSYNFTFQNYIDFVVPYDLIIQRIGRLSKDDWNAYLDIEPLMNYENFSFDQYFLKLFENAGVSPFQKILVLLKGLYASTFTSEFYDFVKVNKSKISKNQNLTGLAYNNFVDDRVLEMILSKTPSTAFIQYIVDNYTYESDILFYDIVFYYYLNSSYAISNTLYTKFETDLNNILEEGTNATLLERMYTNPSYQITKFGHDNKNYNYLFTSITSNIISYEEHQIVTLKDEDIDDILNSIYVLNTMNSFIENLELHRTKFASLNLDPEVVLTKSMNKLSSPRLFLWLNFIPGIPYRQSLNNEFGKRVIDFIFYSRKSNEIYQDIYNLYTLGKIDLDGLYFILGTLSLHENIPLEFVGKEQPLDRIINVNLNLDGLLNKMRLKIQSYSAPLFGILPPDNENWKQVILKSRHFQQLIDYNDEMKDNYENLVHTNKQMISLKNYQGFVELIVNRNIQTPVEFMHLLDYYEFSDTETIETIVAELKILNKLNKFFYKNWIDGLKLTDGLGYQRYVPVVIRKLIESEFLSEEDVLDIIDIVDEPKLLMNQISFEYTFKKDIQEFKFYKELSAKQVNDVAFIKSDGSAATDNPSSAFNATRSENLSKLLSDILQYRSELEASIETNKVVNTSQVPIDVTKIYNDNLIKINEEKETVETKELTDDEIEELVKSKKFGSIYEYLKKISKDNGNELDAFIKLTNEGLMAAQMIVSNSDPTQVLTDAMMDDLINNGIIPQYIKDNGVNIEVNTFPSYFMAYNIAGQLGSRYNQRKGLINNDISIKDLFTNDNLTQDMLDDMIQDFQNIMKDTNQKYLLLKNAYCTTISYTTFIHNRNNISFNPDFDISYESKYKIDMAIGQPKITANKGGDGMIIIEKN